jgi:hypothetical protein
MRRNVIAVTRTASVRATTGGEPNTYAAPAYSHANRRSVVRFKEWGDYFVGGVWTTTNARGRREEIRCEWILDKSFIRLTWKTGAESREEFHGIDPATGQWTIWGFDSKGRVYKGVGESGRVELPDFRPEQGRADVH